MFHTAVDVTELKPDAIVQVVPGNDEDKFDITSSFSKMCDSINGNVSCLEGQNLTYKSNYIVFPKNKLVDDKYLVDFTFKLKNEGGHIVVCIKIPSITIKRFEDFLDKWTYKIKNVFG